MKSFGMLVLLVAVALGGYAFFVFNTTVSSQFGSVHNIGLLQERQNLLIVAGIGAVIGALMLILGSSGAATHASDDHTFSNALKAGNYNLVEKLLADGKMDPNGKATDGVWCWLRLAVSLESVEGCRLLLQAGADPNQCEPSFDRSIGDYVRDTKVNTSALREIKALFADPPAPTVKPSPAADAQAPAGAAIPEQLAQLVSLRSSGALTEEEFARAKARILA